MHLNNGRDYVENKMSKLKNTLPQETKRDLDLNIDGNEEKIEQQETHPGFSWLILKISSSHNPSLNII